MHAPLIGITTSLGRTRSGFPAVAVQTTYVEAIVGAGGVPVLIPSQLADAGWQTLYQRLDGILLTGGGDIRVELFDGIPHQAVDDVDDARDTLELALVRSTISDRRPFLGICRGMQVINVALGGTLHTHIPDQIPGATRHDWSEGFPRSHLAHPVRVEQDSRIAGIFGEPLLQVNSLHHQGIRDLAPELKAVAFAPDGIIEAVELPGHPFGFAVQWHPECLTDQAAMQNLFRSFVEAAGDSQHK